jgi:hypothetical protein
MSAPGSRSPRRAMRLVAAARKARRGAARPDREAMARAVAAFLEAAGAPIGSEDRARTPGRVADAWADDLIAGYALDPVAELTSEAVARGGGLVVVRDIPFHSTCVHHLLPFFGRAHVAYLRRGARGPPRSRVSSRSGPVGSRSREADRRDRRRARTGPRPPARPASRRSIFASPVAGSGNPACASSRAATRAGSTASRSEARPSGDSNREPSVASPRCCYVRPPLHHVLLREIRFGSGEHFAVAEGRQHHFGNATMSRAHTRWLRAAGLRSPRVS